MLPERAKRTTIWLGFVAIVWVIAASASGAQADSSVTVQNTGGVGVNLRSQPSRGAEILTTKSDGSVLTVTGPEQVADGLKWRPVTDSGGRRGWVAADFISAVSEVPNASPMPAGIALSPASSPTPRPTVTPTPVPPGPPLDLEIKFKYPELERRDDQTIYVWTRRGNTPVQNVAVSFTVEDEDPEVERIASNTNEEGRSSHDWSMRRFRGTTVVKVKAVAPDGGEGKATKSFFVR